MVDTLLEPWREPILREAFVEMVLVGGVYLGWLLTREWRKGHA